MKHSSSTSRVHLLDDKSAHAVADEDQRPELEALQEIKLAWSV